MTPEIVSKEHYRFTLRTLTDPVERVVVEAGPFTAPEAEAFGAAEIYRLEERSGRKWVFSYSPIIHAQSEPERSFLPEIFLALAIVLILAFVWTCRYLLLRHHVMIGGIE